MFFTIWDNIRDYLQNSISIGTLFTLIIGIIVGFLIALMVYLVIVVTTIKKSDKENSKVYEYTDSDNEKKNKVNEYINNSISRYDDMSNGKEIGEKYNEVKEIVMVLVTDIAKTYYPESKHPLAELTIEEVIMLDRYIVERIEGLFEKKVLKFLYRKKISTALYFLDKKKALEESKIIKQAKKYHATDVFKTINNIIQAVNPAYWVKKGIVNTTVNIASNQIFRAIIRIIGSETAKVYSKNVFIVDEETINQEIDEDSFSGENVEIMEEE